MAARGRQNADAALIAALAAGDTVKDAAKRAKVSERTAYRRLDDDAFRMQLAVRQDAILHGVVRDLVAAAAEAVQTLRGLLGAGKDEVRLAAARVVLDRALRLRESIELAERVRRLEEALQIDAKERRNGKP